MRCWHYHCHLQRDAARQQLENELRAAQAGLEAQREQSKSLSTQLADAKASARLTVRVLRCEATWRCSHVRECVCGWMCVDAMPARERAC